MTWLISFVVFFALGAAVFKFAVALLSPENHLNTFPRALVTSALIAASNVAATAALGPIGGLIGFVVGVVVIRQAYQLAVWRVLLIMVFNALIAGLLGGFIGSIR